MKQSWQTLNTILNSAIALQKDEALSNNSLEIKDFTEDFTKSIQPYIQELSKSNIRSISLIESSLQELERAESIWHSKVKITQLEPAKIWEQIAIVTELSVKIKQLGEQYKKSTLIKSELILEKEFNKFIKQYFQDRNSRIKTRISRREKAVFNKNIKSELIDVYQKQLEANIIRGLNHLFANLQALDWQFMFICCRLFDTQKTKEYIGHYKQKKEETREAIANINRVDNLLIADFPNLFDDVLEDWQGFGDIYYQEVVDLKTRVIKTSSSRIELIIDDRVKLFDRIIEEIIAFYSNLLEQYNRYCQESSQQRSLEKKWIEQQKAALLHIKKDIQSIK